MSHDWLMMTLEREHDLIMVLKPHFLPKRLRSTKNYFIKAIDHTFYGFTGVITHLGCWKNSQKACKSLFLVFSQHYAWFITPVIPQRVWSIDFKNINTYATKVSTISIIIFSFSRSWFPKHPYRLSSRSHWQIICHQIML